MRTSVLNVAAAAALAFSGIAAAANITEWKSRSVYQLMVDRFARTDGSITATCEAHLFCNGTWKGLTNNLDYIQDMGFTAIQISPVVKNIDDHTAVGDAYHGYWSVDNYAINERFGSKQDYDELVAELKKRDILLMVDVVVNNMVQAFTNPVPPKVDYKKFNPFNDEKYFHPYCNVTMWENSTDIQKCWLYPYGVALADLNTESPDVVAEMGKWIKQLVSNYSIDGLRIDAAKHVNDAFLPTFVNASGVFAWGEILTGVTIDMCRYQEKKLLPGMPNYLEFYPLNSAFNGGSMQDVLTMKNEANTGCTDVFALGSFIENHDMPRFASINADLGLAKNAMAYIMLNDGIPTVYQGQEQHFKGNSTPFNREPLWQSGYDKKAPLYVQTATLNKLRSHMIKTNKDYLESHAVETLVDQNHLCLKKGPSGGQVVFCISNKSSSGDPYKLNVAGFEPNDAVVEVLGCTTTTADGTGTIVSYQNKGEPKVYTLASSLQGTGLCPTTTVAVLENKSGASPMGLPSAVAMAAALMAAIVLA